MTKTPESSFNYSSSKHFLYRKQEKNETLMIDALFWRKNCFTYLNDKRKLQMFFSKTNMSCRCCRISSLLLSYSDHALKNSDKSVSHFSLIQRNFIVAPKGFYCGAEDMRLSNNLLRKKRPEITVSQSLFFQEEHMSNEYEGKCEIVF